MPHFGTSHSLPQNTGKLSCYINIHNLTFASILIVINILNISSYIVTEVLILTYPYKTHVP